MAKNGVISVFGNVKAEEVKQLFEQTLATMKPGDARADAGAKPSQPVKQTVEVESLKDKAQGVLMVGYRGADMFSPDRYALELIDEASSDLGSRFFVRIREQMGLAYYVGSSQMQGLVPGTVRILSRHRSAEARGGEGGVAGRNSQARERRPDQRKSWRARRRS